MGVVDATAAVFVSDSRGGPFITFQLCPALALAPAPVNACCETPPPSTGKTPFAMLIGALPFPSNGCTGTSPSNPVFDRMKTPVTGPHGTNPLTPPPNPNPAHHNHPKTGSNTHPP